MADEKSLLFIIRANVSDFNKAMGDAQREFKRTLGNIQADLKNVSVVSLGIAAAIVTPLALAFKDSAQWGEDITNLSAKLGMNLDQTQRWSHVMKVTGQTGDDLILTIKTLSTNIDDASNGSKTAQDKFARLGLSWEELKTQSPSDQLYAVMNALSGVTSETDKITIATDLLGRGGQKVLPALAEGFQKLWGSIKPMSDGMVEKLAAGKRAMEELQYAWQQMIGKTVATAFGEDATKGIEALTKKLNELSDWITAHPTEAKGMVDIALGVAAIAGIIGTLAGVGWAITSIVNGVMLVAKAFTSLAPLISGAIGAAALVTIGAFAAALFGVGFFIYALVTEWDRLGQLIGYMGDIIRNNLNIAINQARLAFMQARDGIVNAWNTVVVFFTGIADGVKNAFTAVGNWLTQPFRDAWAQIQQFCNDIRNSWNNLFSGGSSAKVTVTAGVPRTAMGGIVTSPQIRLVGESGPEAIVPLSKLDGMGGGSTVNINVGNYMGDEMSRRALVRDIQRILNEENRRSVTPSIQTSVYSVGGHL